MRQVALLSRMGMSARLLRSRDRSGNEASPSMSGRNSKVPVRGFSVLHSVVCVSSPWRHPEEYVSCLIEAIRRWK